MPFRVLCNLEGYRPVKKLDRDGVQMGLWQYACVKVTPFFDQFINRGRDNVRISECADGVEALLIGAIPQDIWTYLCHVSLSIPAKRMGFRHSL